MNPSIEDAYKGFPLALVEVRPAVDDFVTKGSGQGWLVDSVDAGGCIRLSTGDGENHAEIRPTCTGDGLYWSSGGHEQDGWALRLKGEPSDEPGDRSWELVRLSTAQLVRLDVLRQITIRGA